MLKRRSGTLQPQEIVIELKVLQYHHREQLALYQKGLQQGVRPLARPLEQHHKQLQKANATAEAKNSVATADATTKRDADDIRRLCSSNATSSQTQGDRKHCV